MAMARDLQDWDPRYDDYLGWGDAGANHLPPTQPPARSSGHSWTIGRRPRGLYVKNVPGTMSADSVQRLFSECGQVESVVMGRAGPDASKPRWAIINPHSTRDAVAMVSALHGRPPLCLSVTPAISPEEKRRQQREKEKQQHFLEEVKREALAARRKDVTPAAKTDRLSSVITTTSTPSNTTITSTSTTSTSSPSLSSTALTTNTTNTSTNTSTSITSTSSSVNSTILSTTTTSTTTTPHSKSSQTPFEVSRGVVVVAYRPVEPCVGCGASGHMVCSVCEAWYCSRVCQEAHWPLHQNSCAPASASTPTMKEGVPSSPSPKVAECFTMD